MDTDIPIAILRNKIDISEAVTEEEIRGKIGLSEIFAKITRPMELFMCSVTKRIGYSKAFEWITTYLKD